MKVGTIHVNYYKIILFFVKCDVKKFSLGFFSKKKKNSFKLDLVAVVVMLIR